MWGGSRWQAEIVLLGTGGQSQVLHWYRPVPRLCLYYSCSTTAAASRAFASQPQRPMLLQSMLWMSTPLCPFEVHCPRPGAGRGTALPVSTEYSTGLPKPRSGTKRETAAWLPASLAALPPCLPVSLPPCRIVYLLYHCLWLPPRNKILQLYASLRFGREQNKAPEAPARGRDGPLDDPVEGCQEPREDHLPPGDVPAP